MSNTLERLRASKQTAEAADYQAGYDLGKRWAEHSAEVAELQRLESLYDDLENDPRLGWDSYFENDEPSVYGTDEGLFFAMHPDADKDRRAAEDFWACFAGDAIRQATNPGAFLKGFAEGARDLWLSVKDEL
jgi:hypothetical protein